MAYRSGFSINKDLIVEYTDLGYSDKKIAELMDCTQPAIYYARTRFGIERKSKYQYSKYDQEAIKKYVDLGYKREEIIELTGISTSRLNSLSSENGWNITPKRKNEALIARIYQLIDEGYSNSEIAEIVNRSIRTISGHRKAHNNSK